MAKKIMNDIITSTSKKSIRQIPLSKEKKERIEKQSREGNINEIQEKRAPSWKRKPLNPKFVLWLIAIICLLALFFGISILFSSSVIIITPKTEKITFTNDQYTARLNPTDPTNLSFEVLNIKQETGKTIAATEEKEVSLKATGKIVIYNNYSTAPQRLINNTRFEATNGKIYRINSSVVVPGLKNVSGKIVPGSIEATVYADQAGEDYNMKLSDLTGDFKIPGFKGDPRYEKFYARLKEDITGGFVGKQRIVSSELRKTTEEEIKLELKEQLLKELYTVKPDSYIFFKNGYSIDYTNLGDTAVDNDKVKINIEGNLHGIVFNNMKLSKYIALDKVEKYDGLATELIPTENLTVEFSAKDNTGLWKNTSLDLKLNGEVVMKWIYDEDAIKRSFAGKSETDLKDIMADYSSYIKSIKVLFRPVWARYIPDDLDKIKIREEIN